MGNEYSVSIITINLNNDEGLQKTLRSIKQQTITSYEHIIIDGGSIDNSKETISQYAKETSRLSYWISEKDHGIYHAMNKGIAQAKNEYLLFINSGDYLEPDILNQIKEQITGEDIIYGDFYLVLKNGERELKTFNYPDLSATSILIPEFYIPHPSSLIKRALFKEEQYSEHYKIISDWEFFVKNIIIKNCTTKYLAIGISNFVYGGISTVPESGVLVCQEKREVLSHLFPKKVLDSLNKFAYLEQSPLCDIILKVSHTTSFQIAMTKLILVCYKIYSLLIILKRSKRSRTSFG